MLHATHRGTPHSRVNTSIPHLLISPPRLSIPLLPSTPAPAPLSLLPRLLTQHLPPQHILDHPQILILHPNRALNIAQILRQVVDFAVIELYGVGCLFLDVVACSDVDEDCGGGGFGGCGAGRDVEGCC